MKHIEAAKLADGMARCRTILELDNYAKFVVKLFTDSYPEWRDWLRD